MLVWRFALLNVLTFFTPKAAAFDCRGDKTLSQMTIAYNHDIKPLDWVVKKLNNQIGKNIKFSSFEEKAHIQVFTKNDSLKFRAAGFTETDFSTIKYDGYRYQWSKDLKILRVFANEGAGAANGLYDLKPFLNSITDLQKVPNKIFTPTTEYRIVKFNLPWSPYRNSPATTLHTETCRDLAFWEAYLDMMVDNKFNVLSLWNKHPFSFMIRSKSFPKATGFSEKEMLEWQQFWTTLFKMAKDRGIQTFIVNWNIVVSPEFAKAYNVLEYSDLSDKVKAYTKESVTQIIDEYPDLTGIGVTLADWMGNFDVKMNPQEREDWIAETFVAGMKAAKRPVKFLHRSVLAGDPMAMRQLIDKADFKDETLVEIKFNWSHGHSTPTLAITHDYHSGALDERFWKPTPENYKIQWMVRNEDFFILKWGQTDFIRNHIQTNLKSYVNGYFVGSEGCIPATDYSLKPDITSNWKYMFEKQWLFYAQWGRLLYDINTPNSFFIQSFEEKYGKTVGHKLFEAYQLASKMPLTLASFYRSTWDYTLYSEGFLAPEPSSKEGFFDRSSPFISIEELMEHETLDPNLLSIKDYLVDKKSGQLNSDKKNPIQLADELEKDGKAALKLIESIKTTNTNIQLEKADAQIWAYLSLYFANKLRAGVAFTNFKDNKLATDKKLALKQLKQGLDHWSKLSKIADTYYKPVPHVALDSYKKSNQNLFSWSAYLPEVKRDIEIVQNWK